MLSSGIGTENEIRTVLKQITKEEQALVRGCEKGWSGSGKLHAVFNSVINFNILHQTTKYHLSCHMNLKFM